MSVLYFSNKLGVDFMLDSMKHITVRIDIQLFVRFGLNTIILGYVMRKADIENKPLFSVTLIDIDFYCF